MKTTLLTLMMAAPLAITACSTASAHSPHYAAKHVKPQGNWVLNPRKCPDLLRIGVTAVNRAVMRLMTVIAGMWPKIYATAANPAGTRLSLSALPVHGNGAAQNIRRIIMRRGL